MTGIDPYLPWLAGAIALILLVFLFRYFRAKKEVNTARRFITSTFQAAIDQKTLLDLKLLSAPSQGALPATIRQIKNGRLLLQTREPITEPWRHGEVEAYFRVGLEDSAVFYVFTARVLEILNDDSSHQLLLSFPERLRVEKKRHFLRVQPNPKDILMLGVWPIKPGQRLPGSSDDMDKPMVSWKSGNADKAVRLDNISAAGLAISIDAEKSASPADFATGRQILTLLIYRPGEKGATPVIFWSTGEIKNLRQSPNAVTLGLEFTNTAIQEQGSHEIHWTHSSPWRGVKPILHWVQSLDRTQN